MPRRHTASVGLPANSSGSSQRRARDPTSSQRPHCTSVPSVRDEPFPVLSHPPHHALLPGPRSRLLHALCLSLDASPRSLVVSATLTRSASQPSLQLSRPRRFRFGPEAPLQVERQKGIEAGFIALFNSKFPATMSPRDRPLILFLVSDLLSKRCQAHASTSSPQPSAQRSSPSCTMLLGPIPPHILAQPQLESPHACHSQTGAG